MAKSLQNALSAETEQPWYHNGLRFECTGCGNCCTGSPGYVWVNQAEIDALAKHLGMSVKRFEKKYVRKIGIRRSLKELPRSYDCVFFDGKTRKCQVYELRPRQCRTWPFWKSNIRTPQTWEETCHACPGSGRGKLYQLEAIEEQADIFHV
ncbi:MAG: YkgJ family cysteine cluster protein [Pirellulales bacterium]|nr:YkgJ family cysteine cluster protein [Pirellulales bacterium]